MKILIIEDSQYKRDQIIKFFKDEDIEFAVCEYVNSALRYIRANNSDIAGIILDLGLETMPGAHDATPYRGLDVLEELRRKKIDIPVLVNSTTPVDMLNTYPSVYGHRTAMDDYDTLKNFISFLRQKEEQ